MDCLHAWKVFAEAYGDDPEADGVQSGEDQHTLAGGGGDVLDLSWGGHGSPRGTVAGRGVEGAGDGHVTMQEGHARDEPGQPGEPDHGREAEPRELVHGARGVGGLQEALLGHEPEDEDEPEQAEDPDEERDERRDDAHRELGAPPGGILAPVRNGRVVIPCAHGSNLASGRTTLTP